MNELQIVLKERIEVLCGFIGCIFSWRSLLEGFAEIGGFPISNRVCFWNETVIGFSWHIVLAVFAYMEIATTVGTSATKAYLRREAV
jgi:uncharacterized membrane protein